MKNEKYKYFSTQLKRGESVTIVSDRSSEHIRITFDGIKSDNTCKIGFELERDLFIVKDENERKL